MSCCKPRVYFSHLDHCIWSCLSIAANFAIQSGFSKNASAPASSHRGFSLMSVKAETMMILMKCPVSSFRIHLMLSSPSITGILMSMKMMS